jgi:hypothetical protein
MFSREQASKLKEEFWTTFGRYMSPVPSAEQMKVNWVNYHTRVKDVYFRMDAGNKSAMISISLEHRDHDLQEIFFDQLLEFKTLLHHMLEEEWQWEKFVKVAEGKIISRISKEITHASVHNKDQWPELISFFKPRIIALDAFWADARYTFESLR